MHRAKHLASGLKDKERILFTTYTANLALHFSSGSAMTRRSSSSPSTTTKDFSDNGLSNAFSRFSVVSLPSFSSRKSSTGVYLLLWVDHHDEAYDWARNKKCEINPKTGAIQVFDIVTTPVVEPAAQQPMKAPRMYHLRNCFS